MDTLPAAIGRYDVKALIARGGMGTLYLAADPVLQRHVAIKLLRDGDNDELRARFAREARAAANLRHRNIVTIFDIGEHDGRPFMAMEYIQGQTLTDVIAGDPQPSTVRKLQLMEDLCAGLSFAQARGVIHRDIKPANLMLDAEGVLKILDFGIARAAADAGMTQAGLLIGTLSYMSPEQVAGGAIDGRSDMFAVGAVMYELLARRQAFPGAIDTGVLHKILTGDPQPLETLCPHLDPTIPAIVRRAMQKAPEQRFRDLEEMRAEIARLRHTLEASTSLAEPTIAPALDREATRVTPRRGTDRDELVRRRTRQIERHVAAAREAFEAGHADEALTHCEEALLLDPNEARALDIADRIRLQRDEAHARQSLEQAQEHVRRGDLTAASQHVREALALVPHSHEAVELARVVAEARLARERERQRAEAIRALLNDAQTAIEANDLAGAIAACDEILSESPGHDEAQRIREGARQALIEARRQAREREAQRTADDARRLFDAGQTTDALALLDAFRPPHPTVSRMSADLRAEIAAREAAAAATGAAAAEATVFLPRDPTPVPGTIIRAAEPVPPASDAPPHVTTEPPAAPAPVVPSRRDEAEASRRETSAPAAARTAVPIPPAARPPRRDGAARTRPDAGASTTPRAFSLALPRIAWPPQTPMYAASAALVALALGTGMYMLFSPDPAPDQRTDAAPTAPDGAPGGGDVMTGLPPVMTPPETPDVAGAPPVVSDADRALERWRVATRDALRAGDRRAALSAALSGLKVEADDPELLSAVRQMETEARRDAVRARTATGTARAGTPGYVQGEGAIEEAERHVAANRLAEAIPAWWRAEELFTTARAQTPPPPAAAPDPPRARETATIAEADPTPEPPPVTTPPPSDETAAAPRPDPRPEPPPAEPPRSAAPPSAPPPVVDHQALIRATLAAYAQGYRDLDAAAVARVYPGVDAARLAGAFEQMRSQDLQIENPVITISGDRATVVATVRTTMQPATRGSAQTSTQRAEFTLQRNGSGWVILQRR